MDLAGTAASSPDSKHNKPTTFIKRAKEGPAEKPVHPLVTRLGTTQEEWERNRDLETESARVGVERFLGRLRRVEEKGHGAQADYARALMSHLVAPLASAIRLDHEDWQSGKVRAATRKLPLPPLSRLVLKPVDQRGAPLITPEVAAFIALRDTFNILHLRQQLQVLCRTIGTSLEDEIRWAALEAHDRKAATRVRKTLRENGTVSASYRHASLAGYMRAIGVEAVSWKPSVILQIGLAMVQYLVQANLVSIDALQRRKIRGKWDATRTVSPTPSCLEWIERRTQDVLAARPGNFPMTVPPKPWSGALGGGFWWRGRWGDDIAGKLHIPEPVRPLRIARNVPTAFLRDHFTPDDRVHYRGLNAVQETAWRINPTVYSVAKRMWESGAEVPCFPPRENPPLPPKPLDDAPTEEWDAWKKKAREIYDRKGSLTGKRIAVDRTLNMASRLRDDRRIYFAHQCDFRGRIYAVGDYLNPQAGDLAKGLLQFSEGKPIGDGAEWLAIHVANTWGKDKESFDDRLKWVYGNTSLIRSVAEDPIAHRAWTRADAPFPFLAACVEFAGYLEHGRSFVSSLPIALDGSCSGIQHYSLLTGDPRGAHSTNLLPADRPQDIYRDVAAIVIADLRETLEGGGMFGAWAAAFLRAGIDRTITKRPVMVLPYGGTRLSCFDYVREAMAERDVKIPPEEMDAALIWLGQRVWKAMEGAVAGPMQAMTWIRRAMRTVAKARGEKLGALMWVSPSGFVVRHWYPEMEGVREDVNVKTRGGDRIRLQINEQRPTDTASPSRMETALPPNFIHSLDAAHLVFAISKLHSEGYRYFATVHDSFGVHAADTAALGSALRSSLVQMYADPECHPWDILLDAFARESLETNVGMPPIAGGLDFNEVLRAQYAFA